MRAITLPPIVRSPEEPAAPRRKGGKAREGAMASDDTPLVQAFARAGWLGPAGGVGRVIVQCPWEDSHTTGVRFDSSTVVFCGSPSRPRGWFHCSHGHCVSRSQREVLEALPLEARAVVRPEPVTTIAAQEAAELAAKALLETMRTAPPGLTIISAECGLGKTHAAELVALERAASGEEKRSPQTKTAISVDKHKLAVQIAEHIRERGMPVRRFFGPLSMKDEHGDHECKYHDVAKHLVHGRQSMQWELCEGRGKETCAFKTTCRAAGGVEGPQDARITVGPHQLVSELSQAAGATGLLIIDEPPSLLETEVLHAGNFDMALAFLHAFQRRYAMAVRPALRALRGYLVAVGELEEVCSAADAVRHGADHVDPQELAGAIEETEIAIDLEVGERVLACVKAAHYPDHRGTAPPLQGVRVAMAKGSATYAAELGAASRVLDVVYSALISEAPVSVRIEEVKGERVLLITSARQDIVRALHREGSVIVTDANAAIHAPLLAKVVGYEPPFHHFCAPDGAPVHRTHIRTYGATRRHWISHGRLVVSGLIGSLRAAIDWLLEDTSTQVVGIISVHLVELAIAMTLRPEAPVLEEQWAALGQCTVSEVRAELGPLLARLPAPPLLGHYGALRGLNSMAEADAIITLGDPWMDLAHARNDGWFLGLGDLWRDRYEALARAELEQAHGRLRAIHRRRPARALHIGGLLPSGAAWSHDVEVRERTNGRPPNASTMKPDEAARLVAALGGTSDAAKKLGCSRMTVSRYVSGNRAVPPAVSGELRRLAIGVLVPGFPTELMGESVTETPRNKNREARGFGYTSPPSLAIGVSVTEEDDDGPPDGGSRVIRTALGDSERESEAAMANAATTSGARAFLEAA